MQKFKAQPAFRTASKTNDLEALKKAVEDAASVSGGLWLSYLLVLFYLAVAAGAVTHADLFFENPVKLPFLNIELPLRAFFFLAPILFLICHAYALVHFVLLTNKTKTYDQKLRAQLGEPDSQPEAAESERAAAIGDALRRQLPSNIFVQFLAGPKDIRQRLFGFLLAIAWTTLVFGPIGLLLLLQVQFLPYHDVWITREHRAAHFRPICFSCGGCGVKSFPGAAIFTAGGNGPLGCGSPSGSP